MEFQDNNRRGLDYLTWDEYYGMEGW